MPVTPLALTVTLPRKTPLLFDALPVFVILAEMTSGNSVFSDFPATIKF